MTQYEIIQMANEAGLNSYRIAPAEAVALWERFAALVVEADRAMRAAQPATADDRAAFKAYLEDCDECAIVPDIAGAFHAGWTSRVRAAQPVAESAENGTAYAALPDESYGSIMGAAYDFRDAHISGSMNLKRSAHAALETAVRNAISAPHGQAPASTSGDFIRRTNEDYAAWCATKYTPEFNSKGPDLHGLWAWQEQQRRMDDLLRPTTQPAPQQEAQEPVAVVVPCYTPSGKRVALYSAKQDLPIGTKLYTAPQPSPAAQGDALDTMRLDWLDADESRCVFHLGKSWYTRPSYGLPYRKRASLREAIDAARAAQEGNKL